MRRYLLPLGLLAGGLAVVGAFVPVLAAVGGGLSILVFIVQHRTSGPVVIPFTTDDWVNVGETWELRIPKGRHGRRNPSSTMWRYLDHGWDEIIARPSADPDGNRGAYLHADAARARQTPCRLEK